MGVFFVNSQQDADMLRRANGKVEVQNHGTVSPFDGKVDLRIVPLLVEHHG